MLTRSKNFSQQVDAYFAAANIAADGIRNIATNIESVGVGATRVPVTVNYSEPHNSWICSPYTTYVSYAVEEIQRFGHPVLTRPLAALCRGVGGVLRSARIDDAVAINNWLVSTNCYPDISSDAVGKWIEESITRWPRHAIWFRSLNNRYTREWLDALRRAGCVLIPSRQVYLYDAIQRRARRPANLRRDFALLNQWSFRRSESSEWNPADFQRAEDLYGMLYLQKYSRLNPQYTAALLSAWSKARLLPLVGYRSDSGELVAVVGMFEIDGTLTAPIVGYDTSLPMRSGLYRLLMATVFERAADTHQRINLSAGAAEFKRLRGGTPEMEFSAVFVRHLPMINRRVVSALSTIARRVGEPVMRRYQL
jgi:hypothetical protein